MKPRLYVSASGLPPAWRARLMPRDAGRRLRPPRWSQAARMRHDKAQRPDDMRRDAPEYFAFPQRLAYQAELVILQIAQTAMDQLGAGRGGVTGQVGLFAQQYAQTTTGRVTGDAGTIDAATDDDEVIIRCGRCGRVCVVIRHVGAGLFQTGESRSRLCSHNNMTSRKRTSIMRQTE